MTTGEQDQRGPEGPPSDEALGDKIDRVSVQLEEVRVSYDREAVKRDDRIHAAEDSAKWGKIGASVAILVGVVGIVVGVSGFVAQDSTNANTQKARVGSCLQYNRQQIQQAKAERDELRALVDFATPPKARKAAAQLRILKLYAAYDATVAKAHPLRDCTPAGIARYLSKPK